MAKYVVNTEPPKTPQNQNPIKVVHRSRHDFGCGDVKNKSDGKDWVWLGEQSNFDQALKMATLLTGATVRVCENCVRRIVERERTQ